MSLSCSVIPCLNQPRSRPQKAKSLLCNGQTPLGPKPFNPLKRLKKRAQLAPKKRRTSSNQDPRPPIDELLMVCWMFQKHRNPSFQHSAVLTTPTCDQKRKKTKNNRRLFSPEAQRPLVEDGGRGRGRVRARALARDLAVEPLALLRHRQHERAVPRPNPQNLAPQSRALGARPRRGPSDCLWKSSVPSEWVPLTRGRLCFSQSLTPSWSIVLGAAMAAARGKDFVGSDNIAWLAYQRCGKSASVRGSRGA